MKTHVGLLISLLCLVGQIGCDNGTTQNRQKSSDSSKTDPSGNINPTVSSSKQSSPPNILLISLDTVRADHLGCYGYVKGTTPNLDRLAAEGIRFDQCRTQATWTLPAHMSVFTSLLPSHHGVDNLNRILPRQVLLLTEVLQEAQYQTAALVNNGQMRAHWGFDRGFDLWREFEVDTPEGAADNITDEALSWLQNASNDKPYFLFLHYYDAHDPYHASSHFSEKFGVTLSSQQCRELCFSHRSPEEPDLSKELIASVISSYDAGLAELDHEIGRLLKAVGPETLVVIFSDHGEAFEEHGWMLHGATLYEEEVRVPLLMRLPQSAHAGKTVRDSTMLLDIAPTLLSYSHIQSPQQFQGTDLRAAIEGSKLPPRFISAESKAVLEGRFTRSVVIENHKAIWSMQDGSCQLFQLPDERNNIATQEPKLTEILRKHLNRWLNEESFWMVHNTEKVSAEVTLKLSSGGFGLFLPLGFDPARDSIEVTPDGNELTWRVGPSEDGKRKSLLLEPTDRNATMRFSASLIDKNEPALVFIGPERHAIETLPITLTAELPALEPDQCTNFEPTEPGLHVMRYQTAKPRSTAGEFAPLDKETIRQLRSLGYLR